MLAAWASDRVNPDQNIGPTYFKSILSSSPSIQSEAPRSANTHLTADCASHPELTGLMVRMGFWEKCPRLRAECLNTGVECYEKTGVRRTEMARFAPAGGSHAINTTMCIGNRFIRAQYTLCPHTDMNLPRSKPARAAQSLGSLAVVVTGVRLHRLRLMGYPRGT